MGGKLSIYPSTKWVLFFPLALRPNADHGLLILEVSRSQRHITFGMTSLDK